MNKLSMRDLRVSFKTVNGMVHAVRGVSLDLAEGETLAIVGESGSGKSVTSRAIIGILAKNAVIEDGSIIYEGEDLVNVSEDYFHKIRGRKIGMIFQDPMSSLNPIMRIGRQITEGLLLNGDRLKERVLKTLSDLQHDINTCQRKINLINKNSNKLKDASDQEKQEHKELSDELASLKKQYSARYKEEMAKVQADWKEEQAKFKQARADLKANTSNRREYVKRLRELKEQHLRYRKVTKQEAYEKAIKVMNEVGIPEPEKRFMQYPFQFSGGMRQRIVIAIALTANPDILICDEPTTALDVTIQAQILELINDLKKERNLSVIFITHDLGVVANMADRVSVMYAGKIVEYGTVNDIFYNPKHPYTWALLSSMPDLNSDGKGRLQAIPGTPPNMLFPPKGDAFADRNEYALKIDFEKEPPLFKVSEQHYAATWLLHEYAPEVTPPQAILDRQKRGESVGVK